MVGNRYTTGNTKLLVKLHVLWYVTESSRQNSFKCLFHHGCDLYSMHHTVEIICRFDGTPFLKKVVEQWCDNARG